MTIASFVVACVAALTSAGAVWYARAQKLAAVRSAAAAEESAKAALAAEARAQQAEQRSRIVWSLSRLDGSTYILVNSGTETAFGVCIDAGDLMDPSEKSFGKFPSGYEEPFSFTRTFGTKTEHVKISWHERQDQSDEPRHASLYVR